MKILFIGPYRQADGWGSASRALIRSILTISDIDLTIRPIVLARGQTVSEEYFNELEHKINDYYDIVIQHSLPEFFHWYAGSRNIGFCLTETNNLTYTPWITPLNIMDEIWVSSNIEKRSLIQSGCTTPVSVIGEAINTDKFLECYEYNPSRNFTFYTIGNGERKNFNALLLAFHREFDRNEPVDLLIKSSNLSHDSVNNLKKQFGIYKNLEQYKQETIINDRLSDKELNQIHRNNQCFVMPSYGEAWCRPALDSLGFGTTPIVTDNTGMTDFVNNDNGWIVPSYETPCLVHDKPLEYLYTCRETWYSINILELQKTMREVYTNKELRNKKKAQGLIDVQKYSYVNIGNKILEILKGDN